ncbi:hypothetical protein NDU88_008575 [Pleurodeles waltl]|uniref:Uncharacterized protein n=1 Tax=Pleurodeles waltl TaxID=8319 RepID=A0AAV7RV11_PLEWA|nr:hypothetical protein NDU88_008575 [Pleurodeles waltl]
MENRWCSTLRGSSTLLDIGLVHTAGHWAEVDPGCSQSLPDYGKTQAQNTGNAPSGTGNAGWPVVNRRRV